ncbi:putative lysine-specific demethylase [Morus notabilis]|uniref:Putative lysine-specific demethylase n=1 Tax=Morus notabilis TaxID=981085 RepID=W9RFC3_9ROSA|nr:putative lysine-specific demethylase [Morus notabilis]
MGREHEGTSVNNESTKNLPVPPGFASHTSFRLKRIRKETENSEDYLDVTKQRLMQLDTMFGMTDKALLKRYLRHRPWISDSANYESEKFEFKQFDKDKPSKTTLPKGVIRGCPDCSNSLKVTARWRPKDARTDTLEEAPVFHPTEEEFKDTLKYIAKIRPSAEQYGICRIVPPPSWNPPCVIKEKNIWESSTFVTHLQRIDGLQVSSSRSKTTSFIEDMQSKRRRTLGIGLDYGNALTEIHLGTGCFDNGQRFESVCGPEFTAETFKRYADDFKGKYFGKNKATDSNGCSAVLKEQWEPSLENIEGEYKRIVDNPTEEIEVLCCDNLEAGVFGSGFPMVSNLLTSSDDPEIVNSGWNLNNVSLLRGSLLSLENSETSYILAPRVRMGMCFSSLCWRVEEHLLYSLCYLHLGAPKIWYGIPGGYSLKFQTALKNLSDELCEEQPDLHHRQVSPGIRHMHSLKNTGI